MAYEMKPNTGSLFKNTRKETDTHPDYTGNALIDGLGECWVDAWINTPKGGGDKYMSLKIKPKNADQRGSYARQEPAKGYTGSYHGDPRTNGSGSVSHQPASQFDDDSDVPF